MKILLYKTELLHSKGTISYIGQIKILQKLRQRRLGYAFNNIVYNINMISVN